MEKRYTVVYKINRSDKSCVYVNNLTKEERDKLVDYLLEAGYYVVSS